MQVVSTRACPLPPSFAHPHSCLGTRVLPTLGLGWALCGREREVKRGWGAMVKGGKAILLQAATLPQGPSIPAVSHGALGEVGGQNSRPCEPSSSVDLAVIILEARFSFPWSCQASVSS